MKRVEIKPNFVGAISLWCGSDSYSFSQALKREPLEVFSSQIDCVYEIKPFFREESRYCIEYKSGSRDCLVSLAKLPEGLGSNKSVRINPIGALFLFARSLLREPSALLIPLALPMVLIFLMRSFGFWDEYVLHNSDILAFFARPGCDITCVRKVMSIHSLVALLFVLQLVLLLMPLMLLFFQAPKYKSALNYRLMQTYSIVSVLVGLFVFGQLVAFFPFKQYGKFVELGFDPKVERLLSNLKEKK